MSNQTIKYKVKNMQFLTLIADTLQVVKHLRLKGHGSAQGIGQAE